MRHLIYRSVFCTAAVLAVLSSIFTLGESKNSWRASAAFANATILARKDPHAALVADLLAIAHFPFEADPRREAYSMVGQMAFYGQNVGDEVSEKIYKISTAAGGRAPNLLTARLYWLLFSGHAANSHHDEAMAIIRHLKTLPITIVGLETAESSLQ